MRKLAGPAAPQEAQKPAVKGNFPSWHPFPKRNTFGAMPDSRAPGKLRRKNPGAYPASLDDPSLAGALAELQSAMDLPELWRAATGLLDLMLPVYHFIAALPCVEDRPIWISTTLPESAEPGYWERFIGCEPPLARVLAQAPLSTVVILDDHWPAGELLRTPFYERVMRPEGWLHAGGFLFWENGDYVGHIGINRTAEQGPFLASERELLQALHPHLDAAVKRVAAFDRERAKRAALEEVLKEMPDGLLVLDWELRPVFANRAAEEACHLWNDAPETGVPAGVKDAAGTLLASSEALLRQPPPGKLPAPATEIFHPTVPGLGARVRILHPRAKQAIKPHCLIEFSRVVRGPAGEPGVAAAFSLTTAERRVAELVAMGRTNSAVASELSLSVNTIRAHLREIFSKLGIRRRGELAAALAGKGRQ